MIIYFSTGDYKKSLFWLSKILNDKEIKTHEELHYFSMILNLIIHFELGNEDLLEYKIRSVYRFLQKRKRLYQIETSILDFIRKKLPKIITQKELIEAFKVLKKSLLKLPKPLMRKERWIILILSPG